MIAMYYAVEEGCCGERGCRFVVRFRDGSFQISSIFLCAKGRASEANGGPCTLAQNSLSLSHHSATDQMFWEQNTLPNRTNHIIWNYQSIAGFSSPYSYSPLEIEIDAARAILLNNPKLELGVQKNEGAGGQKLISYLWLDVHRP